jgi:hypothetical protein
MSWHSRRSNPANRPPPDSRRWSAARTLSLAALLLPAAVAGAFLLTQANRSPAASELAGPPAPAGAVRPLDAPPAPRLPKAPLGPLTRASDAPSESAPAQGDVPDDKAAAPGGPGVAEGRAPEPVTVQLGIYLNEIQGVDLTENAYTVDFYMWLRWTGDIDPSATLDFVNEDAKAFPRSRPFYEEPIALDDGSQYQGWHVLSTFKTLFDFADSPRDRHVLAIDVEDNSHDANTVLYTVASKDVQYDAGRRNIVGGWRIERAPWASVSKNVYKTAFGDADFDSTTYSRVTFHLELTRPASGYLMKSIIPISIVILMTMLTYLIGPRQLDARLGVCITALISAVVLHSDSTSELPTVGYFVLFDWVYILAYLAIFLSLLAAVLSYRLVGAGRAAVSRRLDLWSGLAVAVGYLVGIAVIALV